MTQDEIIWIAREAGLSFSPGSLMATYIARFAAKVAEEEREACAKVAEDWQTAIHDPRYECDCATAIRARSTK